MNVLNIDNIECYRIVPGQSRDFSLLAGTGTERTVGVAVKPGSGLLARGTIIQMGADGLYVPAETGKMADGACAVLESDTQTGSEVKGVAPSALAYSHGFFLKGKLSLKTGKLTAADLLELRRQGITTDNMDGELNNEVAGG